MVEESDPDQDPESDVPDVDADPADADADESAADADAADATESDSPDSAPASRSPPSDSDPDDPTAPPDADGDTADVDTVDADADADADRPVDPADEPPADESVKVEEFDGPEEFEEFDESDEFEEFGEPVEMGETDEGFEEFEESEGFDRVDEDAVTGEEIPDAERFTANQGQAETAVADPEADTDGGVPPVHDETPADIDGDHDAGAGPGSPLDPADEPVLDPDDPLADDDDGFGGGFGEGPDHDEEMPLAAHIEEMMRRLGVVFLVAGVVTLSVFGLGQSSQIQLFGFERYLQVIPSSTWIINTLWTHNIPNAAANRPRLYGPIELLATELKVAGLAGLVVGLPVFVYQTYLFMRPGLYRTERRYYLAAIPTSLVLALVGIAFAHFLVLPALFAYFTSYTERAVVIAFGLQETFTLILALMGYMAVIFQIPLFIMLAVMMNLVTRTWMEDRRIIFWGVFATIAFFATPDPTGMAPIVVGATMIALFEGTLALLRWTGN